MPEVEKTPASILSEIQQGLKKTQAEERLKAIEKLSGLAYSSETILRQLEKMAAKDRSAVVRTAALSALDLPVHRQIFKRISKLPQSIREVLVKEIHRWEKEGLLKEEVAEALERRYAFDFKFSAKSKVASPVLTAKPAKVPPPKPLKPKKPKRSLAQVLFSESSIKIALYLGAFFVIAAALIFAAAIEELRLPILLFVTIGFLLGALSLKKRLPQPSFTLFIVFSTLLAVDAGVLSDMLNLRGDANHFYWAVVFFFIAAVWGFSIWFYQSRFFSVMAFGALLLSVLNFADPFDVPPALDALLISLAAWGALLGVKLLIKWKDKSFAKPLFFAIQISLVSVLLISFFSLPFMESRWSDGWWFAGGLTWLLIAAAFIYSNMIWQMPIFPYLAVGALIPVLWMMVNSFGEIASSMQVFLAWFWGTFFLAANVAFSDFIKSEKWKKYSLPFLLGSGVIFTGALSLASIRAFDVDHTTPLFLVLIGIAISYVAFHIYRPQLIFWSISLTSVTIAYFFFFELPFMENIEFFIGYKLALASLLLLLPDSLLPRETKENPWRIPLQILGGLMTFSFMITILEGRETDLQAALLFGLMAVFFFFYAMRLRVYLAYIATTFLVLAIFFASEIYGSDLWLPALMTLAVIYYGLGLLLKKQEKWTKVFRFSCLILGSLLVFTGLVDAQAGTGWYKGCSVLEYSFVIKDVFKLHTVSVEFIANVFNIIFS
ncbi:MAG: hypothetical protein HN736_03070 [Anaerolineae bacterium]|nr:hypothetical protein [Anaerolineae bacterium]MBT4312663.1 hypothetical protein [Anaerolineae bacterium]MBT4459406.1 hypothetical protein [Anaerolineae bacterium]MBT6061072.1 hypothetical protein [Anaerolineae bacterium]MBT6322973.1 hypothetical protein [Anaerolineae bacterium]